MVLQVQLASGQAVPQELMVPLGLPGSEQVAQQVSQAVTEHLEPLAQAEPQVLMGHLELQEHLEQPELAERPEHLERLVPLELAEHLGHLVQQECGAVLLTHSARRSPMRIRATESFDTTTPLLLR